MAAARRWHHAPSPSPLLLLFPVVGLLAGLYLSLRWVTTMREWVNAVGGHNGQATPVRVTIAAGISLGALIAITAWASYSRYVNSEKATVGRFLSSPGWARRARNGALTRHAVKEKLPYMLPSTRHAQVEDASIRIGSDRHGKPVLLACDESILVTGPPGSYKDQKFVVPAVRQWPGFAFITNTKADLLDLTIVDRARRGPIAVFNPAGLSMVTRVETLRWNPIIGCEDKSIAARRAAALVAGGISGGGMQDAGFWITSATRVLRGCLHAGALAGADVVEAAGWSTSETGWKRAARYLEDHGEPEWAAALVDDAARDPRTSSSIAATLSAALSGLVDPTLRDYLTVDPDTAVMNLPDLIADQGSIYAFCRIEPESHRVFRPWTTLLAAEVLTLLRERAAGRRLEPPALMALNEGVHVAPIPDLPGAIADGRGHNLSIHLVAQDTAQLEVAYGREQATAITASIQHRLLLAAGGDDTASEWSELIGRYRRSTSSRQHKGLRLTAEGVTVGEDDAPIMPASELRHLPRGVGVLLPRGAPAMPVVLDQN